MRLRKEPYIMLRGDSMTIMKPVKTDAKKDAPVIRPWDDDPQEVKKAIGEVAKKISDNKHLFEKESRD